MSTQNVTNHNTDIAYCWEWQGLWTNEWHSHSL